MSAFADAHKLRRDAPFPSSPVFAFAAEVEALLGAPYAKSWLSSVTCQYTDDCVWTSDLGVERLGRECGEIAKKHGVEIKADAASRAHFRVSIEQHLKARGKT